MKKGALLFILLICIASVNATTYYVSKNGADTNGGTSWADSWLTINKSNIGAGADTLILVGDGLYIESYSAGSADYLYLERNYANRTLQAQNQSMVTINGSSASRVIRAQPNANNLTITGFVLEGDGSTSSCVSGIAGTGGVYLINNTFQNCTVQGLDMTTLSIWKNITGNTFINTNYGLVSSGNNNTVIEQNNFSNSLSERAMRFNEGRSVNITIKNNKFYDPDDVPIYLDDVGHEGWNIENNLFGTQEEPIRVAAVDIRNSSNVVVRNNTFWQGNVTANWASIYCVVKNCSNIKIYGNHWGNATNYTNITGAGGVGYLMYLINATNGSIENNTAFMMDGNGINIVGINNGVTENLKIRYNNLTYEPNTIPPNRYGIKVGADAIASATGYINNTLIEHNRVIAPSLATSKHMLFTGATYNSTVRYNYVVGAGYGILSKHDTLYYAYNNTMVNQTNFEAFVTRSGHNVFVYNNTFQCPYYNETSNPYAIVAKNDDPPARNVTNLTIHDNLFYMYNASIMYSVSEHGTNFTNIGLVTYNNTFIAENSSRRFGKGPSSEYFNFTYFRDTFGQENNSLFSITDETPWFINISNSSIGNEVATIRWETQESANSTVLYGLDVSELNDTEGNSTFNMNHYVTISDLTPGTMHFFNVSSCDYEGNCNVSATYNFTTTGSVPTTPSSPGSSSDAKTYDESDSQSSAEYDLYWTDVKSGDYVKFKYDEETYKIKVSRVYGDYVKVMLIPGNTYYEVPYEEKNLLDIDSNEGSDIEIKAEAEQFYQVSIYLNLEVGSELEDILFNGTNTTNQTPTGGAVINTGEIPAWKYFPIIIIVLAIGYMVWIKIYKKKN
ncbi:hypothetical protein HN747_02195 [archaeon]|jgi:hypothetical protein|nr:hypothetical protein [archaeon]